MIPALQTTPSSLCSPSNTRSAHRLTLAKLARSNSTYSSFERIESP